MLENVGQAAITVGPLILIAPETAPVVASYVLLVAVSSLHGKRLFIIILFLFSDTFLQLKEGGILLIRFASSKTYESLKYFLTRSKGSTFFKFILRIFFLCFPLAYVDFFLYIRAHPTRERNGRLFAGEDWRRYFHPYSTRLLSVCMSLYPHRIICLTSLSFLVHALFFF